MYRALSSLWTETGCSQGFSRQAHNARSLTVSTQCVMIDVWNKWTFYWVKTLREGRSAQLWRLSHHAFLFSTAPILSHYSIPWNYKEVCTCVPRHSLEKMLTTYIKTSFLHYIPRTWKCQNFFSSSHEMKRNPGNFKYDVHASRHASTTINLDGSHPYQL